MITLRCRILCLLLVIGGSSLMAQQEILSADLFWQQVKINHPVARQAALLQEQAAQELLYARGSFDPKLYASQEEKVFGGKNYYRYGQGGVKIPTAWGIALKAEYDWTDPNGEYLNPDRTIPQGGQAIVGLEVPLLQGLFFDASRSAWRQAQIGQDRYQAVADELRNELFFAANKSYWDWSYAYYSREVAISARDYSFERLGGIRESFRAGDYPAIDTLEAYLQWQSWELEVQEKELQLNHTIAKMRALLWEDAGRPEVWNKDWVPESPQAPPTAPDYGELEQAIAEHPSLTVYRYQKEQLAIERRWKQEQFKPELTFNYNFLANQFDFNPEDTDGISSLVNDNYKWGFTFSQPLLLRKERAGVALTDIKIAQTDWKLQQKQQDLTTKLTAYWQEWETRQQQLQLSLTVVQNYQSLLAAETAKFEIGESSVFLLNSRQQKLLEAQLKLLKTQAELQKTVVALWYTAGRG
ncbi:TolC family protein [Lewinella sp. LCG006]|uniref:TolC family protein n=1 Tax=Lewinella sp. LCG006 TaxID=3231911 RepID=UPI0034600E6A